MQQKSNKKIKSYNVDSLDSNIDLLIPIDEIEINGMPIVISKLDDYKERVYNTSDRLDHLNMRNNNASQDDLNISNISISNFDMLSHRNQEESVKNDDIISDSDIEKDIGKRDGLINVSSDTTRIKNNTTRKESSNPDDVSLNQAKKNARNNKSNLSEKEIKNKQRVKYAILISLVGAAGVGGHKLYTEYKIEQLRLSKFDKESLDLKLIIDTVDDYGGDEYQLDWQEVASILGVITKNRPSEITKEDIEYICSLFIDENYGWVEYFVAVTDKLNLTNRERERAYSYKFDLEEYGYMPERLACDSPQMEFINSIKEGAIKSYKETKILPSITIAQAILESNWGESNLFKESNNLFGIKADPSWKGEYVTFETKEYHSQMIKDKFRKYDSVEDSITDHSNFLSENKRYEEGGVFEAKTYKKQALALQESGYSTAEDENGNKTYAQMLERLIRQYNLQLIDCDVIRDSYYD